MKEMWIVHGSTGEYSDRSEWNVAVVQSEDDAKALVMLLQRQYQSIPPSMLEDRWDHEDEMKNIMSIDPAFRIDYTGTHYFYGVAPLWTSEAIKAVTP